MAKLFVVYFATFIQSLYATCPNGWWYDTAYPQLCYHIDPGLQLDWQDAIDSCSQINATLPIFRTLDESVSFAKYSSSQLGCQEIWIGIQYNTVLAEFTWLDNTSLSFIQGVPPNYLTVANGNITFWYSSGNYWTQTWPGLYKWSFICQIRLSEPTAVTINPLSIYQNTSYCPVGWYYDNSSQICYSFVNNSNFATYSQAQTTCANLLTGASLPVFCSLAEHDGFNLYLVRANIPCYSEHWLGLSDQTGNGTYMWIDGSVSSFVSWRSSYPTCDIQPPSCVFTTGWLIAAAWENSACNVNKAFICQYRPPFLRYVDTIIADGKTIQLYPGTQYESTCATLCLQTSTCLAYAYTTALNCYARSKSTPQSVATNYNSAIRLPSTNVCAASNVTNSITYCYNSTTKADTTEFPTTTSAVTTSSTAFTSTLTTAEFDTSSATRASTDNLTTTFSFLTNTALTSANTNTSTALSETTLLNNGSSAVGILVTKSVVITITDIKTVATTNKSLLTNATSITNSSSVQLTTTRQTNATSAANSSSIQKITASMKLATIKADTNVSVNPNSAITTTTKATTTSTSPAVRIITSNSKVMSFTTNSSIVTNTTQGFITEHKDVISTSSSTVQDKLLTTSVTQPIQKTTGTTAQPIVTLPAALVSLGVEPAQVAPGASLSATIQDSSSFILNTVNASMKQQLGVQQSDLIYSCTFNNYPCDSENDFKDLYNPTLGNCYTFNAGLNPKYWTSRAGSLNGLRIVLAATQSDYSCSSSIAGFRIVIHENNVTPFPDSQGYYIPPGTVNSFSLFNQRTHRLSWPYGDCAPSKFGFFDGDYSIEACQRNCFQIKLMDTCKCADPRYPLPPNATYCSDQQKPCLDYSQQCESTIVSDNACNCPPPCNETVYSTTVSTAKILMNDLESAYCNGTANNSMCDGDFNKNFGILYVYYQQVTSYYLIETSTYGIATLFSDFAGMAGILLGFGIVTFLEILFLFGLCMKDCWKLTF